MPYCTACGRECEQVPINEGPQTVADVEEKRDRLTDPIYSSCCEAKTVNEEPTWYRLSVQAGRGRAVLVYLSGIIPLMEKASQELKAISDRENE